MSLLQFFFARGPAIKFYSENFNKFFIIIEIGKILYYIKNHQFLYNT